MSMIILQCLYCFSVTEFGAKVMLESVIKPYFTIFFNHFQLYEMCMHHPSV